MQKLFKDTIGYVILNYLSLFLTTVRGILLIYVLSPVQLGVYKLIFTYSSYFRYYNLGLNALSFYRAPGRGLEDTYAFLLTRINITLAWSFGILFTLVFSIIWWKPLSEDGSLDFIVWLLGILYFTQLSETYITVAKIRRSFRTINTYNVIFAITSTLLMIGVGYWLKLRGVIIGLALATIFSALYARYSMRQPRNYAITLTWYKIKTLLRHSVITILPGMLIVLFSTVEVWIIAYLYGAEETGYYSVVTTFVNIVLLLNTDSIVFLYSNKAKEFRQSPLFVLKLTLTAFVVIFGVCFAGIFVVDWGIDVLFPRYVRAGEIYKLCFWGIPFLVSRNVVVSYISNNRTIFISVVLFLLLLLKIITLVFLNEAMNFYAALAITNVFFGVILIVVFLVTSKSSPKA